MSAEQAKKLGAQTFEQNQKELAKSMQIGPDEEGKYSLFGIEIPKSIATPLNVAIDTAIGPISQSVANVVFQQTKSIAKSFAHSPEHAHHTAVKAEIVARWAIIFAKPISQFIDANTKYGKDLFRLHKDLKSACEACGGDYQKNRVVKGAVSEAYNTYMERLTLIMPSLISLFPITAYGIQMQRETALMRERELHGTMSSKAMDEIVSKKLVKMKATLDAQYEEKKLYDDQYKIFKKKYANDVVKELNKKHSYIDPQGESRYNRDYDTPVKREQKLEDYFKNNFWSEVKNQMKEEEKAARNAQYHATNASGHGANQAASEANMFNKLLIYTPVMSAMGEAIKSSISDNQKKKGKAHSAYAMITKLKEQMQGKQSVEFVHEHVVEIFQKLEEEIPGGTKFAGGLLEKLKEATRGIAENISEGKLDALSLVKLAGEDLVIEHKNRTKNFKSDAAIEQSLKDLRGSQMVADKEVSETEFLGRFAADKEMVKAAIRKTVVEMPAGPEKDFMYAIMPAEVLEHAGVKKEEIREHRKRAHDHLYEPIAASLIHIAAMEEDTLKKHGVTSKEITQIKELSEAIIAGSPDKVKEMIERKDTLISVVASEGLNEQMEGKNIWTERVAEAKSLDSIIEKVKAGREKPAKGEGAEAEAEGEEKPHAARHHKHAELDGPHKKHDSHTGSHKKHHSHAERETSRDAGEPNLDMGV